MELLMTKDKSRPDKPSKVSSLTDRRRAKAKLEARQQGAPEDRIAELELDMLRVIEMCMELEKRADSQSSLIHKLLRLLKQSMRD